MEEEIKEKLICAIKNNIADFEEDKDYCHRFENIKINTIFGKCYRDIYNAIINKHTYYVIYKSHKYFITKEEYEEIEGLRKEAEYKKQLEELDKLCNKK